MEHLIGYFALTLNLISMSMKSVLHLRICSLFANILYVVYGFLLKANPVFIGASIAILLHGTRIYLELRRLEKENPGSSENTNDVQERSES